MNIIKFIKKSKFIHVSDLALKLKTTQRNIRELVHAERLKPLSLSDGYFIISSKQGYKLTKNPDLISKWLKSFERETKTKMVILKRAKGIVKHYNYTKTGFIK